MAREVILGEGLAEVLQGQAPATTSSSSPRAPTGPSPRTAIPLAGIAATGDSLTDRTAAYLPLATAQDYLVLGGKVHEIAVIVDKLGRARDMSRTIAAAIDDAGLSVDPWQVFAKSFYEAMQADKAGMWVMLVVIVIIVAMGVLNTVLMSVLERRREYGLLKALGTKPRRIVGLVLLEVGNPHDDRHDRSGPAWASAPMPSSPATASNSAPGSRTAAWSSTR